ncbi:MAG: hypothetical protein HFI90_12395, partial [Clostridia bacterium]|nr:hypothetical protein [Clostridia bacterium]
CSSLAAPDTEEETVQKSWEEIRQERMIRYDEDVLIETDSEEEIAEKQVEMKQQMEIDKEVYLSRQQQAVAEGRELSPPLMPMMAEDDSWNCPYGNIVGGYTMTSATERLSINVDLGATLDTITQQAYDLVNAACSYDSWPQGVFRYCDPPYSYPMKTATTEIEEPAWSMVSVTGYSLPSYYFEEFTQGEYWAIREGWTKIVFRYSVCEMYVYWDPSINDSVMDYFYYDVYMPMDVFIGDGASDGFRKLWSVGFEVQDWFFDWCKDVLGSSELWQTFESYIQVDGCDFDLDLLDIPNILLESSNVYQNSNGSSKKLPAIMGEFVSQYLTIDLSRNNITGIIPPELANMGYNYCNLKLSHNKLCGNIPQLTVGMSVDVDVSYNQLTGIYHDATEFNSLNIDANFISDMQISYYIPDYLKDGYTSSERQYHLALTDQAIEMLSGMKLTTEYAKNMTQVVLEGVVQDWDVASELIFEMKPETGFSEYFDGTVQNGFTPKKSGSTSVQLGFTKNNCGMTLEYGDTTILSNVPVINILEDTAGILRKGVIQGEIVQVVVSGRSLQNILTKTFAIGYNKNDLELIDAYAPTLQRDLSMGLVPGSNMNITELIPGSLKFQLTPNMGTYTYWGGVATILKFRAKRTIATAITLE